MRYYQGYFEITIRTPGAKKGKSKKFADDEKMVAYALTFPTGTKVWIMIPALNIGYGMEVRNNVLI